METTSRYGLVRFLTLLAFCVAAAAEQHPANPSDGQAHRLDDGSFQAWDAVGERWLDPESFWMAYTERRGGLTWERGREYPRYAEVSELDTFLVELDSGPCLMEFFHQRWRRANDVRRWGDEFNAFGGCPDAFK